MSKPNPQIVAEIYRTLLLLGAGADLLGVIGSWGDSLPESEVLAGLKAWNTGELMSVKARVSQYDLSKGRE